METVKRGFASDNNAGVHPNVMEALARTNQGHNVGYGNDSFTKKAAKDIEKLFGKSCEVFFVWSGTAANILSVSNASSRFSGIIVSDESHIYKDEAGGAERFSGLRLFPAASRYAKVSVDSLAAHYHSIGFVHSSQPVGVSLTQSTERGTVYPLVELRAITEWAHERNLFVHMDGARFANAVAVLGCSPQEAVEGVDVLSFGMTKNGAMGAEAVVFFNKKLANDFGYSQKQMGHLASKMRFVAVQCSALLEDGLWLENAKHANDMAALLANGLVKRGCTLTIPVETNQVFVKLPKTVIPKLQKDFFFYVWNEPEGEIRLVTSFDTQKEDIDSFLSSLGKHMKG